MDKAYDRLSWRFIKVVLQYLGFNQHWIKMIMECVTSVSFQYLISGSTSEIVYPNKGVRQSDPLSPYFFILCKNILSHLLMETEEKQKIKGIKISKGSSPLSHLLFADDSLVFFQINVHYCRKLKVILKEFCDLSRMKINYSKSELYFSLNCKPQIKRWCCGILGVRYA